MKQLGLDFAKAPLSAPAFHALNPWVMDELLRLSLETRRYQPQWGIAAAFEVLRYQRRRTHGDDFKMNNSHRAWYARELMRREPRLRGFFRTRKSVADKGVER